MQEDGVEEELQGFDQQVLQMCTVHPNTARAELHSMITFHHANTRGSRAGRLRIAHLCVPEVSFLAAPDTDHKYKFSLTHLISFSYLSDSLTNAHKIYGPRPTFTLRCSTAEWRILINPSLTGCEHKSIESKVIETEAIDP